MSKRKYFVGVSFQCFQCFVKFSTFPSPPRPYISSRITCSKCLQFLEVLFCSSADNFHIKLCACSLSVIFKHLGCFDFFPLAKYFRFKCLPILPKCSSPSLVLFSLSHSPCCVSSLLASHRSSSLQGAPFCLLHYLTSAILRFSAI